MLYNALITGANGLIGREFSSFVDTKSSFLTTHKNFDILDYQQMKKFVEGKKIRTIINCAASRDAEALEDNYDDAFNIGVVGPQNLARLANELNARLVHISTDYVFDGKSSIPYTESDYCAPLNTYGKTKRLGEIKIQKICNSYLILRTSWVFGQIGRDFPSTIARLSQTRKEINVIYDQVGSPTYSKDFAFYATELLSKIQDGENGIFHISNSGSCSWYDLAFFTLNLLGSSSDIIPILSEEYPQKARRPSFSVLSKEKLTSTLGYSPRHFYIALAEYLNVSGIKNNEQCLVS